MRFYGLIIPCVLIMLPAISPAQAVDARVAFSQEFYFQGESGIVYITIENDNAASALIVDQIGIWFDWLPAYSWIAQLPQNAILVPPSTNSAPLSIGFGVPSNASVQTHRFVVQFKDTAGYVENLTSGFIAVHDANEIIPQWLVLLVTAIPILTIASIVVPTIATIYVAKRRRKVLCYEMLSRTPVLSIEEEIKGKLKILHNGREVTDVHLIELKLSNTGNVDIKREDYEKRYPVTINFGDQAVVLTAEPFNPKPVDLKVPTTLKQSSVVLTPTLLNAGESITFRMLISHPSVKPVISGRVVGVKGIGESTQGRRWSLALIAVGFLLLSFLLISVLPRWSPGSLAGFVRVVVYFAGILSLVAGSRYYGHFKRDLIFIFKKPGR